MPLTERLQAAIKRARADRSRNAIARAAGLDPALVMRIARGDHSPTARTIDKLLDGLGLDVRLVRAKLATNRVPRRNRS